MIDQLCAQVDGARMMGWLTELARWVKLSGTPEEAESLAYVKAQLDGFGYRTRVLEHDAYISLPGAASAVVDGVALKSITHSMAVSSPPGGLSAPLVYVGEGSEAEFAAIDARGKIVLAEGIASPAVALRASRAGALGQLHISPHEHLHEMCLSPVWGSPAPETQSMLPSTVVVTISQADGEAVKAKLEAGAAPHVELHARVHTGWRRTPILEAEIGEPDAPFILFSGHHDTWYFGVMDNGAANVTMLEVARLLAARRGEWKRGLRLCFWSGHSHGRYSGSAWYADHHWTELDARCAVHVNVDSTGGKGFSVLGEAGTASELAALAAEAVPAQTGQAHKGKRIGRAGDESFWGIGVPAMYMAMSQQPAGGAKMRHSLGWWWHTPDDLLDKIDPDNLVRDTRVYVHTIARLLTDAVLPLDYAAHLAQLRAQLAPLPGTEAALAALDALLARLEAATPDDAALMRLSRALVPLDYTTGDRFSHDPALPQSPWPVLDPLRRLAAAEAGSDAAKLLAVAAQRARNRVLHALGEAGRAIG